MGSRLPYIGVTGFMDRAEVVEVLRDFRVNDRAQLMVGVLASDKTLRGEDNKHPQRFPKRKQIASIFPNDPRVINLIHFNTHNPRQLVQELDYGMSLGGENCHGFQLNVEWPDPSSLRRFKAMHPSTFLVLQIGSKAYSSVGSNPDDLARYLDRNYADGLIDAILLDPSGGVGVAFDPVVARNCIDALMVKDLHHHFGLGVAGGLSGETMHLVEGLIASFPEISIDAEGRLRDGRDDLNTALCRSYCSTALELYRKS